MERGETGKRQLFSHATHHARIKNGKKSRKTYTKAQEKKRFREKKLAYQPGAWSTIGESKITKSRSSPGPWDCTWEPVSTRARKDRK
jgi:hypothetical protein